MEDMELREKVHEAYEGTTLCFYPDTEQLVYEIIKVFRENKVSISQAESVLRNISEIIRKISTV